MKRLKTLAIVGTLLSPLGAQGAFAHEAAGITLVVAPLEGGAARAARVVDAFHAALKAGDTTAAAAMISDKAVVYEAGGAERSKAEYAAGHLAADAAFEKTAHEQILRRTGDVAGRMAWIVTEGQTETGSGETHKVRLTTETMVLEAIHEQWRIVHIHWSSRAAKP